MLREVGFEAVTAEDRTTQFTQILESELKNFERSKEEFIKVIKLLLCLFFFFSYKNLSLFSVKILKKEGAGMLKEVLQNLFLKKIQQDMKLYPRSPGVSIAAGYQWSSLT